MRLFLRNIVLFIIPLLLINLWFYSILYSKYLKEYEKIDLNYKTYLLADSHGTSLLKLDSIHSFYNFAAASDSYEDMKRKLTFLIENSSIERLIITVDDHTLSEYRETKNNRDRSIYYTSFTSFSNSYSFIKDKYLKRYFPLLSPKGRDILEVYFRKKNKRQKGQEWADFSETDRIEKSKARIARQFPSKEKSKILAKSLQEIIMMCQNYNIKLLGIKLPLAKEFINVQGDRSYGADKMFENENIEVLDFKNFYIQENKFFLDGDHLNKIGGKELTKHILDQLN